MGALGRPEKPSERKAVTSVENARAPRPSARRAKNAGEEEELRRALTTLRRYSRRAVKILVQALGSSDGALRVRAAAEICDRAGLPKQTNQAVSITSEPKLVIIRDDFQAPESWGSEVVATGGADDVSVTPDEPSEETASE
jgi:hypothetical protein